MSTNDVIWRKSSYSGNNDVGECVEAACLPSSLWVRDSKDVRRGHLEVAPAAWADFLTALRVR